MAKGRVKTRRRKDQSQNDLLEAQPPNIRIQFSKGRLEKRKGVTGAVPIFKKKFRLPLSSAGIIIKAEVPVTRFKEPREDGEGWEYHSYGFWLTAKKQWHPVLCECGVYHPACVVVGCTHE